MRTQILTISTLAFFAILCFVIDGELLFGAGGIINGQINEVDLNPVQISIYKLSSLAGLSEHVMLKLLLITFALSYFMILFNSVVVLSSICMWIIYWIICNSGIGYAYGADYFIIFLLYYNVLLNIFRNKTETHRYLILMLQLHLCLVYFFGGLGKIVGTDWWDGNAMWSVVAVYSLDFIKDKTEMFLTFWPLLQVLSIGTILLELFYPVLVFFKRTRKFAIISVIAMHVGIAVVMGLYTFALVMITMNLIAYGRYLNVTNPFKVAERKEINHNTLPSYA